MVFSSLFFVFVFLFVTLTVYYAIKKCPIIVRNIWLLAASIFFYAWGEPKFVLVMLLSILINYLFALFISKKESSKALLILDVTINLLILFVAKYLNFTTSVLDSVFKDVFHVTNIMLPIGVSFFTFQAMSYVIDVYRDKTKVQKNPLYVALYISFFPQLVAGPIVRYSTISKQIVSREETFDLFTSGVERFLMGFSKKVILANSFAAVADIAFNNAHEGIANGTLFAWLAAVSYAFQILFDFSGYSDMAIGLGRMFGFEFDENFRFPYAAESVSDFWRRWHISLGTWFRDYVYIPLGGSRVGKARLVFNLFVVWTLTGIWHGANWTFLMWGIMYFILLTFEKLTNIPGRFKTKAGKILYRIPSLAAVLLGWIIFRCETPGTILRFLESMLHIKNYVTGDYRFLFYLRENAVFIIAAVLLCIPFKEIFKDKITGKTEEVLSVVKAVSLIVLFMISVSYLVVNSYNPFIYFNF